MDVDASVARNVSDSKSLESDEQVAEKTNVTEPCQRYEVPGVDYLSITRPCVPLYHRTLRPVKGVDEALSKHSRACEINRAIRPQMLEFLSPFKEVDRVVTVPLRSVLILITECDNKVA